MEGRFNDLKKKIRSRIAFELNFLKFRNNLSNKHIFFLHENLLNLNLVSLTNQLVNQSINQIDLISTLSYFLKKTPGSSMIFT